LAKKRVEKMVVRMVDGWDDGWVAKKDVAMASTMVANSVAMMAVLWVGRSVALMVVQPLALAWVRLLGSLLGLLLVLV